MQTRLNAEKIAPDAMKIMKGLEEYVRNSGLEPTLLELIRTRASQIKVARTASICIRTMRA